MSKVSLNLSILSPTQVPECLRSLATQAEHLSVSPVTALDNNLLASREYTVLAGEFRSCAERIETRLV